MIEIFWLLLKEKKNKDEKEHDWNWIIESEDFQIKESLRFLEGGEKGRKNTKQVFSIL